jgi:hypothetical protein
MKSTKSLIPVKRVLKLINSCKTEAQVNDCKLVVNNYIKSAKRYGVVNIEDLQKRLDDELLKRQEELLLVKIFKDEL